MNKTLLLALLAVAAICRVSFGATDHSSVPQISYKCSIIESDNPIPHDFSKLAHRKGIDVMSAPVATGKVDQEVAVKIVNELIPKYVKGQYSNQRLEPGLSIFLKGVLDQSDIILIGRMRILDVADQSATPESTLLATVSKDLYFSKIVENGKEAWFDVHDPDQKPKYLTVRVVPTLVP